MTSTEVLAGAAERSVTINLRIHLDVSGKPTVEVDTDQPHPGSTGSLLDTLRWLAESHGTRRFSTSVNELRGVSHLTAQRIRSALAELQDGDALTVTPAVQTRDADQVPGLRSHPYRPAFVVELVQDGDR
jgi:hypothetical protein